MLKSYIDLLKNGVNALTSLSIENASISDYFQAVGYEILLILLGLVAIAIVVLAVMAPYLIFKELFYKPYYKYKEFGMFMHKLPNLEVKDVNYWYQVCEESFAELKEKQDQLAKVNGGMEIYRVLEKLNDKTNGFTKEFKKARDTQELINKIKEMESTYSIKDQKHQAFEAAYTCRERADFAMKAIYVVWVLLLIPLVLVFF